jgi:hypothetical protein
MKMETEELKTPQRRGRGAKAAKYRALREKLGSVPTVAAKLGIHRRTLERREDGIYKITAEAETAMRALAQAGK